MVPWHESKGGGESGQSGRWRGGRRQELGQGAAGEHGVITSHAPQWSTESIQAMRHGGDGTAELSVHRCKYQVVQECGACA